jgi:hypothetical protein
MEHIYNGGEVIASGGFGCVFSPALKCLGKKQRDKKKVSKLMTTKHAKQEYEEIKCIKQKLDKIPNYKKYFIIDNLSLCVPSKLTTKDLKNFTKKCSALSNLSVTAKNINKNLDKLMILNIPHGGITVNEYIYMNILQNEENLEKLCSKLKDLLIHGIIPMNSKNVYHCDIKYSNVLVEQQKEILMTRLIDWGLATTYIPYKNSDFPSSWRNRPLQFNVPFSVILFSSTFVDEYNKYKKINSDHKNEKKLTKFVLSYITLWNNERGKGHFNLIKSTLFILFKDKYNESDEQKITMICIANYIVDILRNFTFNTNEGLRKYLDEVFIKIVDIYGFICIYFPFFDILYKNFNNLSSSQLKLFELIKDLFIKYLYTARIQPYNLEELLIDLDNIKDQIQNINKATSVSSLKKSIVSIKKSHLTKNTSAAKLFYNKKTRRIKKNNIFN